MSILINTNREYIIIPITPIGHTFTFKTKQPTYHSTGKNTTGKFLIKREYKKRIMK